MARCAVNCFDGIRELSLSGWVVEIRPKANRVDPSHTDVVCLTCGQVYRLRRYLGARTAASA